MNPGDMILVGRWNGQAYLEYVGQVKSVSAQTIDARVFNGIGGVDDVNNVKRDEEATEGDEYWRPIPNYEGGSNVNRGKPMPEQVVWVSEAKEEADSNILLGFVLSVQGGANDYPDGLVLRVAFRSGNRNRIRTLVAQAQASPCDSFWAPEQPQPVYCDD